MASYGLSEKYLDRGPLSVEKSMADTLKGKPVVIKDATSDKRVQYRKEKEEEGIVSILSLPIMAKEEVIGALRLYSGVKREFTEDEIMLVTALAHQGGLAIQNASMYLMLQQDMKDLKDDIWSHRSWF
jgi:GAF domain-containing protein